MFTILSSTIIGIEAVLIQIETDVSFGLSSFTIVGLPDTGVKEARERIRAALKQSGFPFPRTRITVNLAPADVKKQGTSFDLPIALSLLAAQGECSAFPFEKALILGELALDGSIRPVHGVLAAAILAKRQGIKEIYVPPENAGEALAVRGIRVFAPKNLEELVAHVQGSRRSSFAKRSSSPVQKPTYVDFGDIRGQAFAKRGMEIAAAGGHNVLLKGPPGTGKTLLARALPGILPPLSEEEALEATAIMSIAGLLSPGSGLLHTRPFRTPHHSASAPALIGGGSIPKPGEVSLAHHGVLFLDELPEFSRHVLEHLRQPLEDGEVHVARAAGSVRFPARFSLVAAMNPCPCGFLSDPKRACSCHPRTIDTYTRKLSGPLLDRFDLVIEVPNIEAGVLLAAPEGERSCVVRKRVEVARLIQQKRFQKESFQKNADIPIRSIETWCALTDETRILLQKSAERGHVSARGLMRIRKIARTIADLQGDSSIQTSHLSEALQYRLTESSHAP